MSQQPDLNPKEGEEVFAAMADNKHNKTHVSTGATCLVVGFWCRHTRPALQLHHYQAV